MALIDKLEEYINTIEGMGELKLEGLDPIEALEARATYATLLDVVRKLRVFINEELIHDIDMSSTDIPKGEHVFISSGPFKGMYGIFLGETQFGNIAPVMAKVLLDTTGLEVLTQLNSIEKH